MSLSGGSDGGRVFIDEPPSLPPDSDIPQLVLVRGGDAQRVALSRGVAAAVAVQHWSSQVE
eukprot:263333-Pyramimonas_sp.AAC.1